MSLDGLASGYPTKELVEKMLIYEKMPIYKLEEQKSDLQVVKDAWRDVNSRVSKLDSLLKKLRDEDTYTSMKTTTTSESVAVATADSSATEGSYDIDVQTMATVERVASNDQNLTGSLGYTGDFDMTVNGSTATVSVTGTDTLEDVKNKINNIGLEINATIVDDNLIIEGNNTGAINRIQFTDTDNMLQDKFGFNLDNATGYASGGTLLQKAVDSETKVNGLLVTRSSNELTDVVSDVSFTLKETGSTTIDISSDTEKAYKAVKEFVDQYNSVMDFMKTKSQFNSENGKSSSLQGDATLMRMESRLRQLFTSEVDTGGSLNLLSQLGITRDIENIEDPNPNGLIKINRSKFDEMIKTKPNEVQRFFTAESDTDGFDGLAVRLQNYTDMVVKSDGIIPKRQEWLSDEMEDIDDYIVDLEDRIDVKRKQLISQFTAMETSLANMQNQSSWLNAQISSMGLNQGMMSKMMG